MKKTFIASLAQQINPNATGVIQLFPAGEFRARDGRPTECAAWVMTREIAERLIASASVRDTPYVVDYEHQTLRAAKNGQPAPAAGFFKTLEWREGEGLFATDVEWTTKAAEMIAAGEYRFISPVFSFNKSGQVLELLHAALTNTPAVDGMDEVLVAAASLMTADSTIEGTSIMDELLERLRWMLNLPITSNQDDIIAELNKLIDQLSNGQGTAAASVSLLDILSQRDQSIAALTAKLDTPDPAKWVGVDVMNNAIAQAVAQATTSNQVALATQEAEGLITAALSDGRLFPAQEAWAKSLAKSDPESLKSFINKAPKIVALTTTQTGGQPPVGAPARESTLTEDTDASLAVCSIMGLNPDEITSFIKGAK
ncbi:phage protease [Buttiauxella noackiae]|uniref:phage protease n=1 Tax=Buttiauxella noackiae TaxID=82992 RepID=UPI0028D1C225|nr:phage protease [Buttiauxella noackiae]